MPRPLAFPTLADAFWERVTVHDGCWGWTGRQQPNGYGTFPHRGLRYGHRVSWQLHFGPIPRGMVVMHLCDNPPCTNPAHLSLGTHADNIADRDRKGRGRYGPNAPGIADDARVLATTRDAGVIAPIEVVAR